MQDEEDEEFTVLPPDAIGLVDRFGGETRVCYDKTLFGNATPKDNSCLLETRSASEIIEFLDKYESTPETEVLVMDGYDSCIVGLIHNVEKFPILCYDKDRVLDALVADFTDDPLNDPESDPYTMAVEWFDFNMIGAWMGNGTPCFLIRDVAGY